jgi:hypothetical protein
VLRASGAAEQAGIPSVSLVCEAFVRQAAATGRGLGFDGMPLAVLRGHVDAMSRDEMLASFREHTVDGVVDGLTRTVDGLDGDLSEPAALDVVCSGTLDDIQEYFHEQGWTDGSAIVPPTVERVSMMIAAQGLDPWRSLGAARPSGRDLTVWSVAVNAVMAGCHARQFPVLMAIAATLAGDAYGVEHSGNTTGADALVVASGPSMPAMGFHHGAGAQREGTRANTSVGRWLRLFLRNVCEFTDDAHDKATFGNPAKPVLCEDLEALDEIGWPTLAAESGRVSNRDDVVTMARINSTVLVGSIYGSEPAQIIAPLANGLTRVTGWDLTHVVGLSRHRYSPLVVLTPLVARTLARSGWSKADVQRALYEQARIPAETFERLIGEWSNLTPGRRTLVDLVATGDVPAEFALSDDPTRLVPIVDAAVRIRIAVAGDPGRANALVMSNDGSHGWWTSTLVDTSPSTDLLCVVPAARDAGTELST